MPNPFAVNIFEQPPEVIVYVHGIEPSKVDEIKQLKLALDKRISNGGEAVSLEEFTSIVIPWLRIHRTEVFILNPEKPKKEKKVREPKAKTPGVPRQKASDSSALLGGATKEKKLTKKQVNEKMQSIIMKMAMGQVLLAEEQSFFEEQAGGQIV